MDEQPRSLDKMAIACGLLTLAMGLFFVLSAFGFIPSRAGTDGERWLGVIFGMAFVCGGLAVVIQTCAKLPPDGQLPSTTPIWLRVTLRLLSLAIVVSLAVIGTWVAFGPGDREFGGPIPFLPAWLNERIGRSAFGAGAILTWIVVIAMAVTGVRSLRGRKE